MRLAFEIVDIFHGTEAAEQAQEHFATVFQQRPAARDPCSGSRGQRRW